MTIEANYSFCRQCNYLKRVATPSRKQVVLMLAAIALTALVWSLM